MKKNLFLTVYFLSMTVACSKGDQFTNKYAIGGHSSRVPNYIDYYAEPDSNVATLSRPTHETDSQLESRACFCTPSEFSVETLVVGGKTNFKFHYQAVFGPSTVTYGQIWDANCNYIASSRSYINSYCEDYVSPAWSFSGSTFCDGTLVNYCFQHYVRNADGGISYCAEYCGTVIWETKSTCNC
jgi:hypothetical protein